MAMKAERSFSDMQKKLNERNIRLHKRMQRTLWTEHVSNNEILRRIKTKMVHRIRKNVKIPKSLNEERGLGEFHTHKT